MLAARCLCSPRRRPVLCCCCVLLRVASYRSQPGQPISRLTPLFQTDSTVSRRDPNRFARDKEEPRNHLDLLLSSSFTPHHRPQPNSILFTLHRNRLFNSLLLLLLLHHVSHARAPFPAGADPAPFFPPLNRLFNLGARPDETSPASTLRPWSPHHHSRARTISSLTLAVGSPNQSSIRPRVLLPSPRPSTAANRPPPPSFVRRHLSPCIDHPSRSSLVAVNNSSSLPY